MGDESLNERLARLEERLTAHERLTERELAARDQALTLQAREVERRLEALNNEAGRINAAAALSVPRDVYEADQKATALALSVAKEQIDTSRGRGLGAVDVRAWVVAGVGVAGGLIGIAIAVAR